MSMTIGEHIAQLPYVENVSSADREGCDLRVDTERSLLSVDRELHELTQLPVEVVAFSQVGHGGLTVYVTSSQTETRNRDGFPTEISEVRER